jgi:hypothetical protein
MRMRKWGRRGKGEELRERRWVGGRRGRGEY